MEGKYKGFDEGLYKENDSRAVAAVLQYLLDQGLYGRINEEDIYGPDILMYSGYKKVSYIEAEVKRGWHGSIFPFSTVQVPERKLKFTRKRLPVEFWILNSDCTSAVIIPDYALTSSPLVEVPNSMISNGEKFFQVPLDQCNVISLIAEDSRDE